MGSWKIMEMSLPRMVRISAVDFCSRSCALEKDLAADDPSRRAGHQPQHGKGGDALPAAGFADDAEGPPFADGKIHPVNGAGNPFVEEKVGLKGFDFQQRCRSQR